MHYVRFKLRIIRVSPQIAGTGVCLPTTKLLW